jgi:hypothetical protein
MSILIQSGARRVACAVLASTGWMVAVGCGRASDQPKVPLNQATSEGQTTTQANPHEQLAPAARAALDSGNVAFRAGKYDAALAQYRIAAKAEKTSAAPFFGIYMVAQKLGNKPLADSVMTVIKERASGTATLLTDTAMAKMHNPVKGQPSS